MLDKEEIKKDLASLMITYPHLSIMLDNTIQYIEKIDMDNKALKKGQHILMESRKKWKNRYYELLKKEEAKPKYEYKNGILFIEGEQIYLSCEENRLFSILIENNANYLSRKELSVLMYGKDYSNYCENNLSTLMNRLRKKLSNKIEIETIYGRGYRIVEKIF